MVLVEEFANESITTKKICFFPNRNLISILGRSTCSVYRLWEFAYQISVTADSCEFINDNLTLINYGTGNLDLYTLSTGQKLCSFLLDLSNNEKITFAKWFQLNQAASKRPNFYIIGTDKGVISIFLNGSLRILSVNVPERGNVVSIGLNPGTLELFSYISTSNGSGYIYRLDCSKILSNAEFLNELSSQRQNMEITLTSLTKLISTCALEHKNALGIFKQLGDRLDIAFEDYEVRQGEIQWKRLTVIGDYDDDIFQALSHHEVHLKSILKVLNVSWIKMKENLDNCINEIASLIDCLTVLKNSAKIARLNHHGKFKAALGSIEYANIQLLNYRTRFLKVSHGLVSYIEFMLKGIESKVQSDASKAINDVCLDDFFLYQKGVEFSIENVFEEMKNACESLFDFYPPASAPNIYTATPVLGEFVLDFD